MKSNTDIVRIIDGNSFMDGNDTSMASLGDERNQMATALSMKAGRVIIDDASSDGGDSNRLKASNRTNQRNDDDQFVAIPEEEEV